MKREEGGLSSPPSHTRSNGWLENLHSVIQNTRYFNSGKFATIANRVDLSAINEGPQATVKNSLTIQAKGELHQSSVVRKFRTTAQVKGPVRAQSGAQWAPSRSTAGVTARVAARLNCYATSRLQKYRLTEKGRRLLEYLDKDGGLL